MLMVFVKNNMACNVLTYVDTFDFSVDWIFGLCFWMELRQYGRAISAEHGVGEVSVNLGIRGSL